MQVYSLIIEGEDVDTSAVILLDVKNFIGGSLIAPAEESNVERDSVQDEPVMMAYLESAYDTILASIKGAASLSASTYRSVLVNSPPGVPTHVTPSAYWFFIYRRGGEVEFAAARRGGGQETRIPSVAHPHLPDILAT